MYAHVPNMDDARTKKGCSMAESDNRIGNHRGNRLLALLPEAEYKRLEPHLEKVALPLREVLYEADKPIEHVFFPLTGVTSIVAEMEDGRIAEVGTIGNEGMAGLPVFLGAEKTPTLAFQQVPGEALRMRVDVFRKEIENAGTLTRVLHRYTQALFTQVAQAAACNRLHSTDQRCARWLLMTHDRVGTDEFLLTHEFLGQMLGVRRATVTEVAGTLHKAGLITYSRGKITVLDRQGLEAASCKCYQVIREDFDRLLG